MTPVTLVAGALAEEDLEGLAVVASVVEEATEEEDMEVVEVAMVTADGTSLTSPWW